MIKKPDGRTTPVWGLGEDGRQLSGEDGLVLSAEARGSATLGPGEWAVDEGLGIATDLDGMTGFLIALLVGVGGGIAQMLTFYRPSSVAAGD